MDMAASGITRYARASKYAPTVAREAQAKGLDPALVMGLIAVESTFNERAYRAEPAINDASRGLMQLLYRTAKALGYTGTPDGLYDPDTNVRLGIKYLSDNVRVKQGDVWAAVSAYNNGNGKRATKPTTVCLERRADGTCARSFTAQTGQFFNQPYVDKVKAAAEQFGYRDGQAAGGGTGPVAVLVVLGIGLALARRVLGA